MRERIHLIVGAFASLFPKASADTLTLEQKLDVLARGGLKLLPPFTADDLLTSWTRTQLEKPGFDLLLVVLGMTEEQPPWRKHCINAWHFDTECIEDKGAYVRIAERFSEMAQGSLPLENIQDHVDVESGIAWLAFNYRGQNIRIDCKVKEDWADPALFAHFVDLLAKSDPSKVLLYHDLHGQDCIMACVTKAQFGQLQKSGVPFKLLS